MKRPLVPLTSVGLILALLTVGCDNRRQSPVQVPNTAVGGPSGVGGAGGVLQGTINGGGGKGVLCVKDGRETVEALDLYRARETYGRTLVAPMADEAAGEEFFVDRLARHFWTPETKPMAEFREGLHQTYRTMVLDRIKMTKQPLRPIDDSLEVIADPACRAVQVAVFYDETSLLINERYWGLMDTLNRSALKAHEALYLVARDAGEVNSLTAQKVVGYMFSEGGLRPRVDGIAAVGTRRCTVKKDAETVGYFFARTLERDGGAGTELVFNFLRPLPVLLRTSAFVLEPLTSFTDPQASFKDQVTLEIDTQALAHAEISLSATDGRITMTVRDLRTKRVTPEYGVECQ